jgi:MFS family permease
LLALTFVESFGTVLLERGLYFFAHDVLGFGDLQNLWLALAFGVTYVAGALGSHRIATRLGEKRLLVLSLVSLLAVHAVLTAFPTALLVTLAFPVIGLLQGAKWPVIESYVSAGRTPRQLTGELARYNVTWAVSVPLAMAASGPLIAWAPGLLFAVAALCNVIAALFAVPLRVRPLHLEESHPERPGPRETARLSALLASARWCMLLSYALLFLLAPLMPQLFERLRLPVTQATAAAGVLDLARLACFALLGVWTGWRGRSWPLVLAIAAMPLSFFMILFGTNLPLVLLGECVYGLGAGFAYTAALYYALVVKNASVDAGGAHEGLIGLGFALGPLAGIVAQSMHGVTGGYMPAMLVSIAPLMLLCTTFGLRPLRTVP